MRRIGDKYQLLIRRIILVVVDMISLLLSYYGSMMLYDYRMIEEFAFYETIPIVISLIVVSLGIFAVMKLYSSLWQFASINELINIVISTLLSTMAFMIINMITGNQLPVNMIIGYWMISTLLVGGIRLNRPCQVDR